MIKEFKENDISKVKELKQVKAPESNYDVMDEARVRAIVDESFTNFNGLLRVQSGSVTNKDGTLAITPEGVSISELAAGSMPSVQGWSSTLVWSSTDNDTVSWSTGTITLADGTTYAINSGNTGNMLFLTYIYLDISVSLTTLQKTTTSANAVGANKILVGVAKPEAVGRDATYKGFGGAGTKELVVVDNIVANAASVNEFISNTAQIKDAIINSAKINSLNADVINAGTVLGRDFKANGGSGNDVWIQNDGFIRWRYGGSTRSFIYVDSLGQTIFDADALIYLRADGNEDDIWLKAGQNGAIYLFGESGADFLVSMNGFAGVFTGNYIISESDEYQVKYNSDNTGADAGWYSNGNLRMKCNQDGDVTADGSFTGGGADWGEMFESLEEFSKEKIPNGTSVVLVGDKIRPAKKGESPIGVISATASLVGDSGGSDAGINWGGKYLKDEFGKYIIEEAEWWRIDKNKIKKDEVRRKNEKIKELGRDNLLPIQKKYYEKLIKEEREVYKEQGTISNYSDIEKPPKGAKVKKVKRRKINPYWDQTKKYIPRKERPEWNIVGITGKVFLKKGQPTAENWIKMKDISDDVELWLIR